MASLVTIATYYQPSEALIAKSLLEQHGFTVFLHDRFYTAVDWMLLFAVGGLRLQVPEPEVKDALTLLSSAVSVPREAGDPIECCPHCGTDNVFRRPHWLSAWLSLFSILGASVIFLTSSKHRQCRECGHRYRI